jgi:hypothetical protein
MWFDNAAIIQKIEDREIDFRTFMIKDSNKVLPLCSDLSTKFSSPSDLENRIKSVKLQVQIEGEKHHK